MSALIFIFLRDYYRLDLDLSLVLVYQGLAALFSFFFGYILLNFVTTCFFGELIYTASFDSKFYS